MEFFEIYSKLDENLMNSVEKSGKLILLERRLRDKSMESKITQFRLVFVEKSRSEMKRENMIIKRK